MTNLLPCVKVCCYTINTEKTLLPDIEIALLSKKAEKSDKMKNKTDQVTCACSYCRNY